MSRHPEPNVTASDALLKPMSRWKEIATDESGDPERRSINALCHTIGEKVHKRLQTSLMTSKFSPAWIEPILGFIEESAKELCELHANPNGLLTNLVVQIAASRFESLEFEKRIQALQRG